VIQPFYFYCFIYLFRYSKARFKRYKCP